MRRGTILALGFGLMITAGVRADDFPVLSQLDMKVRLARAKVELAKANLEQAKERAAWAERMMKQKYISAAQREVELVKVTAAELALDKATAALEDAPPSADDMPTLGRLDRGVRIAKVEVELARSNVEQARERAAWAARMVKQKYVTESQAKADQVRVAEAELALVKAEAALRAVSPADPAKK